MLPEQTILGTVREAIPASRAYENDNCGNSKKARMPRTKLWLSRVASTAFRFRVAKLATTLSCLFCYQDIPLRLSEAIIWCFTATAHWSKSKFSVWASAGTWGDGDFPLSDADFIQNLLTTAVVVKTGGLRDVTGSAKKCILLRKSVSLTTISLIKLYRLPLFYLWRLRNNVGK